MADTVTGSVGGSVSTNRTYGSGIFNGQAQSWQDTIQAAFRNSGVAADSVDLVYVKRHTIGATSNVIINLSSAAGDDGVTSNFVRVRALCVRNRSTNDAYYVLLDNAGQATTPFVGFMNSAGTHKVFPSTATTQGINNSGFHCCCAPNTTGAVVGSGINVRISNGNAASVDVDVVILGCSA